MPFNFSSPNSPITNWVAYTPTFNGAGSVSAVEFYSRRMGDSLQIRGKFTTGTVGATVAAMSLGFNGVNGSLIIAGTSFINNICIVGHGAPATNTGVAHMALAFAGNTLIQFSFSGASSPLTAQLGNVIWNNSTAESYQLEVPISGWSA